MGRFNKHKRLAAKRQRSKSIHGFSSPAASTGYRVSLALRRWRREGRNAIRGFAKGPNSLLASIKELFQLAWPITIAMLGESAMGLVDTKLVGGLGANALAGVGMAIVLFYLGFAMVSGTLRGVKVRTAYLVGEGHGERAYSYAYAGLVIGSLAGLGIFFFGRNIAPLVRVLGLGEQSIPFASDYMSARTVGAFFTCMFVALSQYRQGKGDTRSPMIIGIGGNVVNAVLSYALIYGRFGLPALGVRGAGYGTAIAELLELVAMLVLLFRDRARRAPSVEPIPLRKSLREVLGIGVPTGAHFGFEMLAFTTFTVLLAGLGAAEMAAHHIALNTIRASFMPGVAISEAASILIARSLGGRNLGGADRTTRAALLLGMGFMTFCGVLFALFGRDIARAFSNDSAVVLIAGRLLLVAAVFQTLDAANMILRGALRGAKDVRWMAVAGTVIVWCCIPGSALVFGRLLGLGAMGGWLGFVFESSISATLFYRRWTKGSWRAPYLAR